MSITDTIRESLRQSGLTQVQIAAAAGISQRAVSEFLAGKTARSDTIDRLASVMDAQIRVPKSFAKNILKRIVDA